MTEWQPIESAPHRRKVLVGYRNRLNNWRTVVACYYPAGTLELSDDSYEPSEDGYAEEGWYEECESQESIYPVDCEPTHWQSLPPPAPTGESTPEGSLVGLSQDEGIVTGPSDVDQRIPVRASGADKKVAVSVDLGIDRPKHDGEAAGSAGPHDPHPTPGDPLSDAEVFQLLEIHGIPCDPGTAAAIAEIVERAHGIGVIRSDGGKA